jgi:hypothetical protein
VLRVTQQLVDVLCTQHRTGQTRKGREKEDEGDEVD